MPRKITAGLAVVAALAAAAPAASAGDGAASCRIVGTRQDGSTNVVAPGAAAGDGWTSLTLSCRLGVDGAVHAVALCVAVDGGHAVAGCSDLDRYLPAGSEYDTLDRLHDATWGTADRLFCLATRLLAPGVNPWLMINSEGDVQVDGRVYYDCPKPAAP